MKKLLIVVVLLGGVGWLAWAKLLKPEHSACAKMASLCGDKGDSTAKCENDLADMKKQLGDEVGRKFDACIADAKTCPEAAGCLVGAGASGVGDMMNKFMQGLGKGISK
jgi:hypothetical protein